MSYRFTVHYKTRFTKQKQQIINECHQYNMTRKRIPDYIYQIITQTGIFGHILTVESICYVITSGRTRSINVTS